MALLIGWIVQSAKRRVHASIPILSISRKELVASLPPAFGPAVDRHATTQSESWHLMEPALRSEEHTSELQSQSNLVCRLLLEKKTHHHLQATVDPISTTLFLAASL